MKPGRELDALIAEKVMRYSKTEFDGAIVFSVPVKDHPILGSTWKGCPPFSTDISAAWEVVEHVLKLGHVMSIGGNQSLKFAAIFKKGSMLNDSVTTTESAPHAICLAALKAVGYEF